MEYVGASGVMIASFLVGQSIARVALMAFFHLLKRSGSTES